MSRKHDTSNWATRERRARRKAMISKLREDLAKAEAALIPPAYHEGHECCRKCVIELAEAREKLQERMEWAKKMRQSYEDEVAGKDRCVELLRRMERRYSPEALSVMMGSGFVVEVVKALAAPRVEAAKPCEGIKNGLRCSPCVDANLPCRVEAAKEADRT